jgi:hypothetical protein
MKTEPRLARPLREIEQEVEMEGREWMRQRLQEKLQAEADRHGEVFPPQSGKARASAAARDASARGRRRS